MTESTHFANAAFWAATEPRCGLEAFNITNGDYFRWKNLWPRIAEVFDMPVAEPQTIGLTQHMADKGALWQAMTKKYGLQPFDWDAAGGLAVRRLRVRLRLGRDDEHHQGPAVRISTTWSTREEMFCRLLRRFREEKIVP